MSGSTAATATATASTSSRRPPQRHWHARAHSLEQAWPRYRTDRDPVKQTTRFWTLPRRRVAGAPIGLALFGWLTMQMSAGSGWALTGLTLSVVLGGAWGAYKPAEHGGQPVSMKALGGLGAVGSALLLASLASAMEVSVMLPAVAAGFMAYWFTNGLKALLRPSTHCVADGPADGDPGRSVR